MTEDWSLEATGHGIDAVSFRGERVATRVFFSVRDLVWGSPRIRLWYSGDITDSGGLVIEGSVDNYPLELSGSVRVADDELRFTFEVLATADVEVTRAGPCVLSDPGDLGPTFVAAGPAGEHEVVVPDRILLDRTATGFDRLELSLGGCNVAIGFAGELFEMEDQRNWGDATFKSYCPPLTEPQAFLLRSGEVRRYDITFSATPTAAGGGLLGEPATSAPSPLVFGPAHSQMPLLGLRHSGGKLDEETVAVLGRSRPDYLHLLADLESRDWQHRLESDLNAAEQLGIDAVITAETTSDGEALHRLAGLARGRASTVLLFDRGASTTSDELAATTAFEDTGIRVGGGSRSNFASLNAAGHLPNELETVAVPLAVASHNDDRRAVVSSLESFSAIVRDVRRLAGERELLIGPVSFRPTFDSWGPSDRVRDSRGDWTSTSRWDGTEFAAAWTVAAVAALASCDVPRVTIGSTALLTSPSTDSGIGLVDALRALAALRGRLVQRVDAGAGIVGLRSDDELVLGIITEDTARIDYRGRVLSLTSPRVYSDSLGSASTA